MGDANGWKISYEVGKEDLVLRKKRRFPEEFKMVANLKKRIEFDDWLLSKNCDN